MCEDLNLSQNQPLSRNKISKLKWSVIAVIVLVGAVLVGALFTAAFVPVGISQKIQNKISEVRAKPVVRGNNVVSEWTQFETAYLTLEKTEVSLGEVDGSATGGGIDYFGNSLVYAAANGLIGFLDMAESSIEYSDIRVPMDYDEVRRDYFSEQSEFNQNWYRVADILIAPIPNTQRAYLYASHHRFTPDDMNICLYVSRIEIENTSNGVEFVSGEWDEVSKLNACLNMEEREWKFSGHMSGGRMTLLGDDQMLVSVGTYALGNFEGEWDAVQADSGNDLGKIININLTTKETSIYATGFRNPQGLVFDASGRLWEAEHGAQGGDEVNLVTQDANYGWPNVSYGFDYGGPRKPFELNPEQGRHEGYTKPAFSFVPSVAVSNIIPVENAKGFKLWDGDILVLSLKEKTIFRLRPDDGRIVYAEPIATDRRMRDGFILENGWLALLTGRNSVIFIRTVKGNENSTKALSISGYDSILPLEQKAADFEREFSWGQMLFTGKCASCHEVDESSKVGPGLKGIVGRKIGGQEGFPYTDALANASGKWNASKLNAFLADPNAFAEGTSMPGVGMDKYERKALVEYLAELE